MKIRSFKTLAEMEAAHQKDINDFPIVYMFGYKSEKEIRERIAKIGASSLNECIDNGYGGILLKSKLNDYKEMFARHRRERKKFCENEENLCKMILHTMYDHEYGYTENPEDVLDALGKTYDDLQNDQRFRNAWDKAEKICIENTSF